MKACQDHKFQSFYAQIDHIISNTKNKVRIYIITSLAGGSGSGFFLSFAQELKNYLFQYTSIPCHLYGEFVLPTYFHKMISHSLDQRIRIEANAYASLKDMVDVEEIPFHQCDFYHKEDTVETISNQISKYIEYDILVPVDTQIISQYMESYQQAYEYHILHTKIQ